jgi:uncharacterized protein
MLYRRFGRTELQMPVFTCGGMRFQHSWKDERPTEESQRNLETTVERALELGMNHIETARGYGTSEQQLGRILPRLPRQKMVVQTKVNPAVDTKEFRQNFEKSMSLLKLEYIDLFSIHGVNDRERLEQAIRPGGCLAAAMKFKKQGRVKHIGFSTHAADTQVIIDACNDGRFDYVNLHWYFVNTVHWPAIQAARAKDMGVFIISPNDKGGLLYKPSEKFCKLTAPLSPMVFNDLWCLSHEEVHTLSIGASRPSDFDEHIKTLQYLKSDHGMELLQRVEGNLRAEMERVLGREWLETWHLGLPRWEEAPGQVNVFEVVRLYNCVKALDMIEYGKMRYNLLGNGGHWFPGYRADKLDGMDLSNAFPKSPHAAKLPHVLREAHQMLKGEEVKRLSES